MALLIHTGDPAYCHTLHNIECPACTKVAFDLNKGQYRYSATLANTVLVCLNHGKELTVQEELNIQNSFERAKNHDEGRIVSGTSVLKQNKRLRGVAIPGVKVYA